MWQTLSTFLTELGPTLGIAFVIILGLGYIIFILSKLILNKGKSYEELQSKVAGLYHTSLDDISNLRISVLKCQKEVHSLRYEMKRTTLVLMDIRNSLLTLKRKNPNLNGDLDKAIDSITTLLYAATEKDKT